MTRLAKLLFAGVITVILLTGCLPKLGPWGIGPPPPPPPLPPLVPDPLAATGTGSISGELILSEPVITVQPFADSPAGQSFLSGWSWDTGLYLEGTNRPTRIMPAILEPIVPDDPVTGTVRIPFSFHGVPLGNYTVRAANWTYTSHEDYQEVARSAVFGLNEAQPGAAGLELVSGLPRGPGVLTGRILQNTPLPASGAALALSRMGELPWWQRGVGIMVPPTAFADGRAFFSVRGLPLGDYVLQDDAIQYSWTSGAVVSLVSDAPVGEALVNPGRNWGAVSYNYPEFAPAGNFIYGYVQIGTIGAWSGDLRIAAVPTSGAKAWMWLFEPTTESSNSLELGVPWSGDIYLPYRSDAIAYRLGPLAAGEYDLQLELLGDESGESLTLPLETIQLPAVPALTGYLDTNEAPPPFWLRRDLPLALTAEQAAQFAE